MEIVIFVYFLIRLILLLNILISIYFISLYLNVEKIRIRRYSVFIVEK